LIVALIVIGCALLGLFHPSLKSGMVLFSNDGPLGAISTQAGDLPSGFLGFWHDLNWIGVAQPTASPNLSTAMLGLLAGSRVLFLKLYAPLSLLGLGLAMFLVLRRLGITPIPAIAGGLAMALNTDPFSYACWGLPSVVLSMASGCLAFAAVATPMRFGLNYVLAGCAVGMSIMEGYDVGALFSLYVAAFVVFMTLRERGVRGKTFVLAGARVLLVAVCAALISVHTLASLVGTQVKGIAGTAQDAETRAKQWDKATMWSLPKIETLRLVVPGMFGYRMDTPDGGNYWGSVGQSPGVPTSRHSGSGTYTGVIVVLLGFFAVGRSVSKRGLDSQGHRPMIWFWGGAALLSLLLAYGRHAPLYQVLYQLPYFSTIRNPIKFLHPLSVALVVLFAHGVQGLWTGYIERATGRSGAWTDQLKAWWAKAAGFERKWVYFCGALVGAGFLGWLLYTSSKAEMLRYLQAAGFSEAAGLPADFASRIHQFSSRELLWSVFFLFLSAGLSVLTLAGLFSGSRARWALVLLGGILTADLVRANLPWVQYYDYREKYASNPVLDILRDRAFERRVAGRMHPMANSHFANVRGFDDIYNEWLQHHFQYYNIACIDIVQMPRMPVLDETFLQSTMPSSEAQMSILGRLWQLTATRYVLGMKAYLEILNKRIDPGSERFRVHSAFDFVPKNQAAGSGGGGDGAFTTLIHTNGNFAIFEFTGALPRFGLISDWQVMTNDAAALAQLLNPGFDPSRTVLLAEPLEPAPAATPAQTPPGQVSVTSYAPKRIELQAQSSQPALLLINDKYDPDWKVTVDGAPAKLLRANYLMRAIHLGAGNHRVELRYEPDVSALYVSGSAVVLAVLICGVLAFSPAARKRLIGSGASLPLEGPAKS
jgi:hypothetical protein